MSEDEGEEEFFECYEDEAFTGREWKGLMQNDPRHTFPLEIVNQRFLAQETNLKKELWGARKLLPVPMPTNKDFSIWSVLKKCIGKELSKITMPVVFNEPLSFLQRVTEYCEYAHLLHRADASNDIIERMEYVSAFAVSAVASNWERVGKPFNPLLGETYELDRSQDRGYHIVVEQVSHHPPISAFHAEAAGWRFHGAIQPKLRFWGKSVEVNPKGYVTLELLRHGETYTWQNVNCNVHNVIIGKLWVEHAGDMEIINHKTGHRVDLHWKPIGWFSNGAHRVEGFILDPEKRRLRALYGKWIEAMYAVDVDVWEKYMSKQQTSNSNSKQKTKGLSSLSSEEDKDNSLLNGAGPFSRFSLSPSDSSSPDDRRSLPSASSSPSFFNSSNDESADPPPTDGGPCDLDLPGQRLLWQAHARPAESKRYYNFTHFAMTLNERQEAVMRLLPPTDSRLRPDMQYLEQGCLNEAGDEKERLEEKQRTARKERRKKKGGGGGDWQPLWFQAVPMNPLTKKEDWSFTQEYWKREWEGKCPDIF